MTTPTITHKPRFNPTTLDNTLKRDNKQMSVLLAPEANTVSIACNEAITTYFKRVAVFAVLTKLYGTDYSSIGMVNPLTGKRFTS